MPLWSSPDLELCIERKMEMALVNPTERPSMKTKIAILLAASLLTAPHLGHAQSDKKSAGPGDKTDVNIKNTPIDQALRGLAEMAGINLDIDPKITATGMGPDGKTPLPAKPITVSYTDIVPFDALLLTVANNNMQLVTNNLSSGVAYRVTEKDGKALPPLITESFQLKNSTTNLVSILKETLETRSKVIANEPTKQLVVMATDKEMETVRMLVEKMDVPPSISKQVLIEAKILETSMNPRSARGIDWTGTLEAQNFGFGNGITTGTSTTTIPGPTTTTTTTLPGGGTVSTSSTEAQGKATSLSTALGLAGITANTFNGFNPALGILNADGVRGVLSFLNSSTETEVISMPYTVTLDNQQARLEVARSFPVFTQNPGSAQTPATTTLTYTNVGTILVVTPRIAANSNILLKVSPEVSNIDGQNSQTINGAVNVANVYASRRIDTSVVIPSGNTLVMGGLVSDTSIKSNSKVPLLGDTPGFGLLFRRDNKSRTKQNLLIFITPTIVEDYDFQYSPSKALRATADFEIKPDEGPWDSGKPKQWGKAKSKK